MDGKGKEKGNDSSLLMKIEIPVKSFVCIFSFECRRLLIYRLSTPVVDCC